MAAMFESKKWKNRAEVLLDSVRSADTSSSKIKLLRKFKETILFKDSSLLPVFSNQIIELKADVDSPVRRFIAEMIGEIGLKDVYLLPELVPTLISLLKDEVPVVTRQAIATGTILFRFVLVKVVLQGLNSSEIDHPLRKSWKWMLEFRNEVFPMAFQPGNDGIRLHAIKFIEAFVLLYTPDPDLPSDMPNDADCISELELNISWLKGGHPLLNVGELSTEASQSLRLMLDQLKLPQAKSLSNSLNIVLVKSLSAIAKRRPSFYGRILSVLLSLSPTSSVIRGVKDAHHALKNAFMTCLESTHSSATPWRVRLLDALKSVNSEDTGELGIKPDKSSEDKHSLQTFDHENADLKRKRDPVQQEDDMAENDIISEKRTKMSCDNEQFSENHTSVHNDVESEDEDCGPVQQLVGMFSALVAQGDKAAKSLEILISSISSDLLAEVVIANLRQLPSSCPKTDGEDEHLSSMDASVISKAFSLLSSLLKVHPAISNDNDKINEAGITEMEDNIIGMEEDMVKDSSTVPDVVPEPIDQPRQENNDSSTQVIDIEAQTVSEGSGMDSAKSAEDVDVPSVSLGGSLDISSSNCMPDCTSETISIAPPNTISVPAPYVFQKLSVPDSNLNDDQKDILQKFAFTRILESQKEIVLSARSHAQLSLLAHLGIEFPLDLDPWEILHRHILSDYVNNQGHELTLRVLYRLYQESEQDQDFLSSRTAISVYETFLLKTAQSLRDTFPASDKSLGRLLCEVPYLSEGALKLLESLCAPEGKQEKDLLTGDRVTQGLSAVWNIISTRPASRDRCLQIALKSAAHHREEVRMKATRLVANKLYPMSSISQKIEDFAIKNLQSLADLPSMDNASNPRLPQESDMEKTAIGETKTDGGVEQTISSHSIPEAQRCMSLYFALCTKKHYLLQHIFSIYESIPMYAKQAVHIHIPILIRTVGSSPDLLQIISDIPTGSKNLLLQVLQTLTDGAIPSRNLISAILRLYTSRMKDAEITIPLLSFLSKDEVLAVFPQLVNLPQDKFQAAVNRLLQDSPQTSSSLTPAEVLIAIHVIDPEKEGVPLKKIMEACTVCFEQRHMFTQQVLAKALNQLVEQTPLPLLFMRTVIQSVNIHPGLVEFVMEILSRLVTKQIWRFPKLWVGFVKCVIQTVPQSFGVLLQLPATQLENALNRNPTLKPQLIEHASQQNIRATLPRSILLVLGLVNDSQSSGQAHTSQNQTGQNQNAQTSQSQVAQVSLGQAAQVSQSQAAQTSQSHNAQTSQSQAAQTSQSQAAEAISSVADVGTEVTQETTDDN